MAKDRIDTPDMDVVNLDSLPRWQRDLIDLANESAGRETGRAKRFFSSEHADGPESESRDKERRFNALMRRLLDPDYARLYAQAANAVTRAEEAAENAARDVAREAELVSEKLEALRARAAELPDGRKVFLSKDGRIYAEDGSDVTNSRASITGLREGSPSWEEFKRTKERADVLERERLEIEEYRQNVIDPARQRLGDGDNPPGEDELHDIMTDLEEQKPERMKAKDAAVIVPENELAANASAAERFDGPVSLGAADLCLEFRAAHDAGALTSRAPKAGPSPKR